MQKADITLDTDLAGRTDAFNPAELLMAALAGCMIKGIERVTPILKFELRGVDVFLLGMRQDVPPKLYLWQRWSWIDPVLSLLSIDSLLSLPHLLLYGLGTTIDEWHLGLRFVSFLW